ncbi:glycosyltransferase [Frigidibacter sp. MR17.14]|uniref:glycosyltransferase family 2 protein n=1 Tax=Frigidibacter sp. MR17.14 TaxID=3126509 RepID=UPI003013114A
MRFQSRRFPSVNRARDEALEASVLEEVGAGDPPAAPRLAVIISCYNYERYVREAIDSVLQQQRDDCELVVVDDGSKDQSWAVITASGVRAVRLRNLGQIGACRVGLSRTTAPFVLFLDADDILKPGALETIIGLLDDEVAKLQFSLSRVGADGEYLGEALPSLRAFRDRAALQESVFSTGTYTSPPTSGNVFRRDLCAVLAEVDYDTALDGVILFMAPFFGDVVSLTDELGSYRIHGGNYSAQGQRPQKLVMERDIERFARRTEHLRGILDDLGVAAKMVPTDRMYFYIERRICANLAGDLRPGMGEVWRAFAAAKHLSWSAKTRVAMTAFYLMAAVLPLRRAQNLMAYRFTYGQRSVRGMISAMLLRS